MRASLDRLGHLWPLRRLAPPLGWMGVIAVLSSSLFGADRTESWVLSVLTPLLPGVDRDTLLGLHTVLRKLGHLVEYGILAVLWRRALVGDRWGGRAAAWAIGLSAAYAVLDEARQGLAPNRTPSGWDAAIDTIGAGLAIAWWEAPSRLARLTLRAGRWAAALLAAGSLAALVVEWALGLLAGDLALAALGFSAVAWGLRSVERRWRGEP